MLALLKAEMIYNRFSLSLLWIGFLCFSFVFTEAFSPPGLIYLLVPFIAVNEIHKGWFSEQRYRLLTTLPLSDRDCALVRLWVLLIPCIGLYFTYGVLQLFLTPSVSLGWMDAWLLFGLFVFGYLVAFLLGDLMPGYGSPRGGSRRLIAMGIFVLLTAGLIVWRIASDGERLPPVLGAIGAGFLAIEVFLSTGTVVVVLNGVNVGLAALTVRTYGRRRSYV